MPKLNGVLMVVLSVGVIGGMGWWVLGRGDDGAAQRVRTAKLLRKLADSDPDLRREAEAELRAMGARAKTLLRETAKVADARLAERAAALLKELEPAPAAPEAAAVSLFAWSVERFTVQFRNDGPAPVLIALEKKGEEGRFGWFEIEDATGKTTRVAVPSYAPPVVDGPAYVAVVSPGTKQVLYNGWEPVGAVLQTLPKPCKVSFVYDASEGSPYRDVAKVSERGVPLKPARLVTPAPEPLH